MHSPSFHGSPRRVSNALEKGQIAQLQHATKSNGTLGLEDGEELAPEVVKVSQMFP
jgi:hypothetical protein